MMNETQKNGPDRLVENLVATLWQEKDALAELGGHFGQQVEALRQQQPGLLQEATLAANDAVGALGKLRQVRLRQMRLLARVLGLEAEPTSLETLVEALGKEAAHPLQTARAALRTEAEHTRRRCELLDFALRYAAQLGQDLLLSFQDLDAAPSARLYTAAGSSASAAQRSFLDQIG